MLVVDLTSELKHNGAPPQKGKDNDVPFQQRRWMFLLQSYWTSSQQHLNPTRCSHATPQAPLVRCFFLVDTVRCIITWAVMPGSAQTDIKLKTKVDWTSNHCFQQSNFVCAAKIFPNDPSTKIKIITKSGTPGCRWDLSRRLRRSKLFS